MLNNAEKRFLIIATALAEQQLGGHYLSGGDGAIPNQAGSGLFRTLGLKENLAIEKLGVHAAFSDFGTCRGRYAKVGGKRFSKGEYDRDTLLPEYLDELKASYLGSEYWYDFNHTGLFPRLDKGYLYLGEDCRGKKHFDCEGFIAWVLVKALGKDKGTWRKGVGWYQTGGEGRLDIYKAQGGGIYRHADGRTISQGDLLDGDILIRKPTKDGGEHIAFACAKGNAVLHASGRSIGVICATYHANWTELARIKSL
jgi:hypothetical protein